MAMKISEKARINRIKDEKLKNGIPKTAYWHMHHKPFNAGREENDGKAVSATNSEIGLDDRAEDGRTE